MKLAVVTNDFRSFTETHFRANLRWSYSSLRRFCQFIYSEKKVGGLQNMRIFMQHHEIEIFPLLFISTLADGAF